MAIAYIVGEIKNNIKIYTKQGWKMAIVDTVGEISNNNIKIYTENNNIKTIYAIAIFQPCSVYILMLFLISPTVYTIIIFQPCSVYILMLFFLSLQQYIQLRLEEEKCIYC
jgi:hypothetical protein